MSGDLCFPSKNGGAVSLKCTDIWVLEILLIDPVEHSMHRLVLPCPVRTDSFEDLKPILLFLKHRIGALRDGFIFKTEAERACRGTDFDSWCADQSITAERVQAFRHPSFEQAIGQVERSLRKLFWLQKGPGSVLWAPACKLLQFKNLKEADPIFVVGITFKHGFRIPFSCVLLLLRCRGRRRRARPSQLLNQSCCCIRTCHNTVFALAHSESHLGLKVGEFH